MWPRLTEVPGYEVFMCEAIWTLVCTDMRAVLCQSAFCTDASEEGRLLSVDLFHVLGSQRGTRPRHARSSISFVSREQRAPHVMHLFAKCCVGRIIATLARGLMIKSRSGNTPGL